MALQQKVDAETLALAHERAQHNYPDHNPDIALNKYIVANKISNLFFLNEAGERCLWGPGQYLFP